MKSEILIKDVHGLKTATAVNENSGKVEHKLSLRVSMTDGDHDRLVLMFKQKVPVEVTFIAPNVKSDFQVQMMLDMDAAKAEPKPGPGPQLHEGATVQSGEESLTVSANREERKEQAAAAIRAIGDTVRKHAGDEDGKGVILPDLSKEPGTGNPVGNPDIEQCRNCGEAFPRANIMEGVKCPICELPYAELQPSDVIAEALKKRDERVEAANKAAPPDESICSKCGTSQKLSAGPTAKCPKCGHEAKITSEQAFAGIPSANDKLGPVEEVSGNGKHPKRRQRKPVEATEASAAATS